MLSYFHGGPEMSPGVLRNACVSSLLHLFSYDSTIMGISRAYSPQKWASMSPSTYGYTEIQPINQSINQSIKLYLWRVTRNSDNVYKLVALN